MPSDEAESMSTSNACTHWAVCFLEHDCGETTPIGGSASFVSVKIDGVVVTPSNTATTAWSET